MISYFLCDNWYTCDSIMDSFIKYYAYRYEGNLNDIENAVVLITYPKDALHALKAVRAFISKNISLSTRKILDRYVERWPVEVFSASPRINWHLKDIRSAHQNGSKSTGCWCHWQI